MFLFSPLFTWIDLSGLSGSGSFLFSGQLGLLLFNSNQLVWFLDARVASEGSGTQFRTNGFGGGRNGLSSSSKVTFEGDCWGGLCWSAENSSLCGNNDALLVSRISNSDSTVYESRLSVRVLVSQVSRFSWEPNLLVSAFDDGRVIVLDQFPNESRRVGHSIGRGCAAHWRIRGKKTEGKRELHKLAAQLELCTQWSGSLTLLMMSSTWWTDFTSQIQRLSRRSPTRYYWKFFL